MTHNPYTGSDEPSGGPVTVTGQGWPLYAAAVGTGKVFAIVRWERREGAVGAFPFGVEITAGSDTAPYALDLTSYPEVVVGPNVRDMQYMAGPPLEGEAERLLRLAMRIRATGENYTAGNSRPVETWETFMAETDRYLRSRNEGSR